MDYRLAVLFTVILPLILLAWVFVEKAEAMQRLLIIYWRVASLLLITIYLMMGGHGIAFISGLAGRILIPISLWFWVDLNDEIEYQPNSPLKLIFSSWRWAITLYCVLGAIATLPFLNCVSPANFKTDFCQVWLQAPSIFKEYFHHDNDVSGLGNFGIVGLTMYIAYFCYFAFVKLNKRGRSAIKQ